MYSQMNLTDNQVQVYVITETVTQHDAARSLPVVIILQRVQRDQNVMMARTLNQPSL